MAQKLKHGDMGYQMACRISEFMRFLSLQTMRFWGINDFDCPGHSAKARSGRAGSHRLGVKETKPEKLGGMLDVFLVEHWTKILGLRYIFEQDLGFRP